MRALILALLFSGSAFAANPTTGVYMLTNYSCSVISGKTNLQGPAITTQTSGSSLVVWTGHGVTNDFSVATYDNKGNNLASQGMHSYAPDFPTSGEYVQVVTNATGGANHLFNVQIQADNEATLFAVEIKNAGRIQDVQYNRVASGVANISSTVTTTGPATLVAVWSGEGTQQFSLVVTNSYTKIFDLTNDVNFCFIQVGCAVRDVSAAGTYNCSWTNSTSQGAHMWLVAVQAPGPTSVFNGAKLNGFIQQ